MAWDPWNYLILAGTTMFTVALIPQLVRTIRLGRAEDISIPFILLVVLASFANLTYFFVHVGDYIAGAGFIANIVVWSLVLWYRIYPRQP
ncbi:MAG: PQ-loop repeat-containing protein [Thermoplasmatota archaeon]